MFVKGMCTSYVTINSLPWYLSQPMTKILSQITCSSTNQVIPYQRQWTLRAVCQQSVNNNQQNTAPLIPSWAARVRLTTKKWSKMRWLKKIGEITVVYSKNTRNTGTPFFRCWKYSENTWDENFGTIKRTTHRNEMTSPYIWKIYSAGRTIYFIFYNMKRITRYRIYMLGCALNIGIAHYTKVVKKVWNRIQLSHDCSGKN